MEAKRKKKIIKRGFKILMVPVVLLSLLFLVVYIKQDDIIQGQLSALNKGHKGLLKIGDTHLAPFENFPDISFKIDDVKIYETKNDKGQATLDVQDIYIGFNLWDLMSGNYDIHSLLIEEGYFNLIIHEDGSNNIQHALATSDEAESSEALHIHLQSIKLKNLDIHQYDESSKLDVATFIYDAKGGFKTKDSLIQAHIDTDFDLNIYDDGDTTYIHDKHFEFHTDLSFNEVTGLLSLAPSGVTMEHGDFNLEGTVDTKNAMTVDLKLNGSKPSFDMFIAFAPHELVPVLERYDNAGDIYFNAIVKGPTAHGTMPFINVDFGAHNVYLENQIKNKKIDDLNFEGHFTNGSQRNLQSMEFSIKEIVAGIDKGLMSAALSVKNFEKPDVDMVLDANFDVGYLADFLNLEDIQKASGIVEMHMKFHDIIDLDHPELTLKDFNKSYYSELKVEKLQLTSASLPAPIHNLDMHVIMEDPKADLEYIHLKMGKSDLNIKGYLSDLPALVHQSEKEIKTHLEIQSDHFDIAELTQYSKETGKGIDEHIKDLSMAFSFVASGKAFSETKYLPVGEFFIDSLHAQLKNYPHEFHDFHADVFIDSKDLKILDFTGEIDASDFHFNGWVHDYPFWFQPELNEDVDLDFTLASDHLKLENLFTYQGANYVPEDYRHEELKNLKLHLNTSMHFKSSQLASIDAELDQFEAKMKLHPLRFEKFKGKFHYEDEHLMVQDFHGQLGRSKFDIQMNYYIGDDITIMKRDNYLALKSNYINVDELNNFNFKAEAPSKSLVQHKKTKDDVASHTEAFNIYKLPFTNMKVEVDVAHFIHHKIDLQNIHARLRTTPAHYLYVDTIRMNIAGGTMAMSGYFNGSDPEHIYMKPNLNLSNCDIDHLLFKFENFGQESIVSENLHGKLSCQINGKIRVYPDMVPDLDQSEIHMDVQVLKGRLVNYEPMLLLSDYFGDKNLQNLKFDTLSNHIDITEGQLTIPNMTIESTLGHLDFSGTQNMNDEIDYYIRIPWNVIRQAARNKIFGTKKDSTNTEDQIVEVDPNKNIKYLNLRMHGTMDEFKITTQKPKKGG